MKKLLFTATLLLGLATLGFSQEKQEKVKLSPEEHAKRKTEMLTRKLTLTKEQQDKIYSIHLEQAEKMQKVHDEMQKERADNEMKIENILTAEQKKAFQDLKKEREGKMKGRKHHPCDEMHHEEKMK